MLFERQSVQKTMLSEIDQITREIYTYTVMISLVNICIYFWIFFAFR